MENGTESLTAEKVYKILNIFLIAIGFELETFNIDHLNLSVQDERDLLGILDKISQLLEGYEKGKLNFNFFIWKMYEFVLIARAKKIKQIPRVKKKSKDIF